MKNKKLFSLFRKVGMAEGISLLVLLGVAMPLKYMVDIPIAVTIAGSLHGILFLIFLWLAWTLYSDLKKPLGWFLKAFLASIFPFGTFIMDHREWKKEELTMTTE